MVGRISGLYVKALTGSSCACGCLPKNGSHTAGCGCVFFGGGLGFWANHRTWDGRMR